MAEWTSCLFHVNQQWFGRTSRKRPVRAKRRKIVARDLFIKSKQTVFPYSCNDDDEYKVILSLAYRNLSIKVLNATAIFQRQDRWC